MSTFDVRGARANWRRCAAGGLEPEPEPEGPLWIIEERLALALGAVIAIIVVGSAGVAIGQRVLASQRKRAAKLSEAETAKAATAARKTALADAKAAFAQAKTAARARNEADRQAQKAFEERLLAEIREHEKKVAEASAAEAAAIKAEAEAARLEARRIEEALRSKPTAAASGSGGGGGSLGSDEWDVGDYDEATAGYYGEEEEEVEVEEGGAAGGGADDDDDDDDDAMPVAADRMPLDVRPDARGTRITLESLQIGPDASTARPVELWVLLSCTKCNTTVELATSGMYAEEATRKSWCAQCGSLLSATLRPQLVHGMNSVLGHIDSAGCNVLDVPRLTCLMQCGRCDTELTLPPLLRGRTTMEGCRSLPRAAFNQDEQCARRAAEWRWKWQG